MPKLRYLASTHADFREIILGIARQSGDARVGRDFVGRIQMKCLHLASLPGLMRRPRPELREDLRSFAFGNHVIFFRYVAGYLEVVNVLERHRDIDAYLNPKPQD